MDDLTRLIRLTQDADPDATTRLADLAERRDDTGLRALVLAARPRPDRGRWRRLCTLLDAMAHDPGELERTITLMEPALERWPDALRRAPASWLSLQRDKRAALRWRLVRTLALSLPPDDAEPCEVLREPDVMQPIRRVEIGKRTSWSSSRATRSAVLLHVAHMAPAPHLRALVLAHIVPDGDSILSLLSSPRLSGLRELGLHNSLLYDADLERLLEHPLLGQIEALDLSSCQLAHSAPMLADFADRSPTLRKLVLYHNTNSYRFSPTSSRYSAFHGTAPFTMRHPLGLEIDGDPLLRAMQGRPDEPIWAHLATLPVADILDALFARLRRLRYITCAPESLHQLCSLVGREPVVQALWERYAHWRDELSLPRPDYFGEWGSFPEEDDVDIALSLLATLEAHEVSEALAEDAARDAPRAYAIRQCCRRIGSPSYIPVLIASLEEEPPESWNNEHCHNARRLGQLHAIAAIPALVRVARLGDAIQSGYALQALADIAAVHPEAVRTNVSILPEIVEAQDDDATVRIAALEVATHTGGDHALAMLTRHLDHPDVGTQHRATKCLIELEAWEALVLLLSHASSHVRQLAFKGLVNAPALDVALLDRLLEPDVPSDLRCLLMAKQRMLARVVWSEHLIEVLYEGLTHPTTEVRSRTFQALRAHPPEGMKARVRALLESSPEHERVLKSVLRGC